MDIHVYSKSEEELDDIYIVLRFLNRRSYVCKFSKCEVLVTQQVLSLSYLTAETASYGSLKRFEAITKAETYYGDRSEKFSGACWLLPTSGEFLRMKLRLVLSDIDSSSVLVAFWASKRIESNLMLQSKEAQRTTAHREKVRLKLGELVLFSRDTFHTQTDGQSERTIQTLEDMLRACALEWTEFQVGDRVFLKVSPFRGVKRFGIKGKLSPRFIGPFEILERIGEVSYRLALPPQLSHVHDVFHVSLLRGYHYHPLHVASYPFDQIQPDMSLSEEPESILDRQERVMRNKVIPFVKILKNHPSGGNLGDEESYAS
ncbi:hypothetical protein Tco_0695986 [Tanacetum coccineum]